MNTVEQLSARMFRRRISDAQMERFIKKWETEEAPKHAHRERIKEFIEHGHCVTTGWTATSIRGFHIFWICWKHRTKPAPPASVDAGTRKEETLEQELEICTRQRDYWQADRQKILAEINYLKSYVIPEKDKHGKYWHDLAQERIASNATLTAQRASLAEQLASLQKAYDLNIVSWKDLQSRFDSVAEQLAEAKKELKIWRDANNAKDAKNGPRVI